MPQDKVTSFELIHILDDLDIRAGFHHAQEVILAINGTTDLAGISL